MASIWGELKRRNVVKVAIAYTIVGWLLIQVAETVLPTFESPPWVLQTITFLVALGLPLALIIAWAFELTPEGIIREKHVDRSESITQQTGRKLDFVIIAVLTVALGYFVVTNDWSGKNEHPGLSTDTKAQSIAVLPFVNVGGDPSEEYFSDGITVEILNSLSSIGNFRVVGRTSSFSYKGKATDLKTIGATLGVANILEGTVRKSGRNLRISAQLVSASDGFEIWSRIYERELADIFDVQRDIAREIANALRVELDVTETLTLARQGTENLEAYTWFLRGYYLFLQDDPTNIRKAVEAFDNAIKLDTQYVRAYAYYAVANIGLLSWGYGPSEDPLRKAEEALAIGLDLDPDFSEMRLARALLRGYRNDWSGAEEEFRAALKLDPDNPLAQRQWAYLLWAILGRPQEAVELSRKYLQREPLDLLAVGTNALSLAQLGRISEAESELRRIIEIDPSYSFNYYRLGSLYSFFLNQRTESLDWYIKSFELDPKSIQTPLDIARILLDLGDPELAEQWVQVAEHNSAASPLGGFARYFMARYRDDEALAGRLSRELADTLARVPEGYHYIMDFAWLRAMHTQYPGLAKQVYTRLYPELASANPDVNSWNHAAAISMADLMLCCGDKTMATILLNKSLSVLLTTTDRYHDPAMAAAYALQGDVDRSLQALQMAIRSGWRREWWLLERDRIYEPLWELPEFQNMLAEIESDMSSQLERLQEMKQNTDLTPSQDSGE